MKILKTQNETVMQQIIWLVNRLSTIEDRYENEESQTSSVIDYQKHPTQDVWWFDYDAMLLQMGTKGKEICLLLENTTKEEFIQFATLTDPITDGYKINTIL